MGRPWREECNGGIYHVIARGNNKEYIFKDNIDKEYFLKEIKELGKGLEFKIYAYVLMDNHYHFLIQVFETSLQKLMHQINNKYRYTPRNAIRKQNGSIGTVWLIYG